MIITKQTLINKYSEAIESGVSAVFAGAGLSVGAGYVNWVELLKSPAKEIELDSLKEEKELVTLAQYYLNECSNRGQLDELIIREFGNSKPVTKNHKLLASLPIQTYWSTNYDCLIEKALEENGKICDVKYDDSQLKNSIPNRDAVIYKMHGDIKHADRAVLARDDYEAYDRNHILFREVLEGDLISKTFLFLGFSFSDPNLNYILGRIRVLLMGNTRQHYCIIRKEAQQKYIKSNGEFDENEYKYALRKQELQIRDLSRFGINVCLIDEFEELTEILSTLLQRNRRKTIFISGSAHSYKPFSESNAHYFLQLLAQRIVKRKYNYKIVSGYGLGVGNYILNGVVEACYQMPDKKTFHSIMLMPFPAKGIDGKTKEELAEKYREEMISQSGISIFLFGNKKDGDSTKYADGMQDEFNIAERVGSIQLPIRCTGGVASLLFERALGQKDLLANDKKYGEALNLCNFSFEKSITQTENNKLVTSILKAIELLNSYDSDDE